MARFRGSPRMLMIFISLMWVIFAVSAYERKRSLSQSQGAFSQRTDPWQAQARIEYERQASAPPPLPAFFSGNPGAWPPPPSGKVEMAVDMTASNYVIVFDASFSMNKKETCGGGLSRLDAARAAVKSFIAALDKENNVGLVGFGRGPDGKPEFSHPLVSGDKAGIADLLGGVRAWGKTPLWRAMGRGFFMLQGQAQRQGGYGEYHLVIITDGQATDGDPAEMARRVTASSLVQIHAVGFCLDGQHALDLPRHVRYSAASNPSALYKGLMGALAESEYYESYQFAGQ